MKKIKAFFGMIFSLVLVLSLTACSDKTVLPEDQIIYYHITAEPETLDPQIADDAASKLVILNLFEGLVRINKNGVPSEGVAQRWDITDNDTVYTFYLRKDAEWSDGTAVTADDFVYGLQRALSQQTGSTTAAALYSIQNAAAVHSGRAEVGILGVKAVDTYTLQITLEKANSEFLSVLAEPVAMPCNRAYFNKSGGQYGRDDDKIISNGAFYLSDSGWAHHEYIRLRKNKNYKGKDKPVPAGVNMTIGDSPNNVVDAITKGTVDCYALPKNELNDAKEAKLNITSFGNTVWGISFQTTDTAMQYPEIRKALISALDRNEMLKGLTSADTIVPSTAILNGQEYRSLAGKIELIDHSDQAKEELNRAIQSVELQETLKLSILCTNDSATQTVVNSMMEKWNTVTGSYVNKIPVSRQELSSYIRGGEYTVVVAPLIVDGENPLDTLKLFESESSYNPAHLKDSTYDQYIQEIIANPGLTSLEQMVTAEQYLSDNAIFYPLYLENQYYASAATVTDLIFRPYGAEVDFFHAKKVEVDD